MSRPKRGKPLLELIHQQDASGLRTPGWWKSTESASSRRETRSALYAHRVSPPAEPPQSDDRPLPLVSIRGKHVVFSLSSSLAGGAAFALMLGLALSFGVGRQVGKERGLKDGYQYGADSVRASAAGEIEAARNAAPTHDIFAGMRSDPLASSGKVAVANKPAEVGAESMEETPANQTPWVTGHTYIVIQEFKAADENEAAAARLFLRDHGVETQVLESGGTYRYRLLGLKGFNRADSAQRKWCDEYHAKIKELGRLFVKAGGRYDLQGYQKTLTGSGW